MKGAVSLALLLLVACSAICDASGAGEDAFLPLIGDPDIEIVLHQSEMWCDVEPGQSSVAEFTGNVNVDKIPSPRIQYLIVSLYYYAEDWPTSGTSVLTFTSADSTMPFSCTVMVPPMTSSSANGQLEVSGRWFYQPGTSNGDVEPDYASIRVLPYSKPILEAAERNRSIGPLSYAVFELSLFNDGNALDNINLSIEDIPSHLEAEFTGSKTMNVEEKGVARVRLEVKMRTLSAEGHGTITVAAQGAHKGRESSTILVLGVLRGSSAPLTILGISPGISAILLITMAAVIIGVVGIVFFRKRRRSRRISR